MLRAIVLLLNFAQQIQGYDHTDETIDVIEKIGPDGGVFKHPSGNRFT